MMKHIAITGASSGFGAALAHCFYERGYKLTLVARSEEKLRELGTTLSANWHVADVITSYDTLVSEIEQAYGPIDGWVNNAGIGEFDAVIDQTKAVIEETMMLNATAPMVLSRDCAKRMRAGGTIVNVCSTGSESANAEVGGLCRFESGFAPIFKCTPTRAQTARYSRADRQPGTDRDSVL